MVYIYYSKLLKMKKVYSIALFLISLSALSQTPGLINYQGVARSANGDPIVGPIGVSVTIHVAGPAGASVLTEQHAVNTNQFGIFEVRIGSNSPGVLTNIPWGVSSYWLGVAIDVAGGTNYGPEISNQRLLSVPYALYAEKSGSSSPGGSLTASPNVTVTSSGTNTFNINVPNYVAGTNVTIIPLAGNNYQINAGTTSTSTPTGPWTGTLGNVFLSTPSDNVGIGVPSPAAKLEVSANVASTNNAIAAYAQGGDGVLALTSSTLVSSAGVSAQNSGSGNGVFGSAVSTNTGVSGVYGKNSGAGSGVYGVNSSGSAGSWANGVYGETNSSSVSSRGVYGLNNGGGTGVYGRATNSVNINAYGVYGQNIGAGAGIFGANTIAASNPNGHGVNGLTSSTHSMAAGVVADNQGTGSAIRAISGPNSTLSLWVDNGHMKATSNLTVGVVTATFSVGFTGLSYIKTGCNDVKGIININTSATGVSNGESFEFNVSFNKMYQVPPTVVISGYGNDNVTYYLKSISNTFFSVRVINRSGGGLTTPQLANMNVSYYVIE